MAIVGFAHKHYRLGTTIVQNKNKNPFAPRTMQRLFKTYQMILFLKTKYSNAIKMLLNVLMTF
jgi:hypothetical protein